MWGVEPVIDKHSKAALVMNWGGDGWGVGRRMSIYGPLCHSDNGATLANMSHIRGVSHTEGDASGPKLRARVMGRDSGSTHGKPSYQRSSVIVIQYYALTPVVSKRSYCHISECKQSHNSPQLQSEA